jgi:hypothetical protein
VVITSPEEGTTLDSTATIAYRVAANPLATPRTATIQAGGGALTVQQAARVATSCAALTTFSTVAFGPAGGSGNASIVVDQACGWTATSTESWLTFEVTSGTGTQTIRYQVASQTTGVTRSTTVSVAGRQTTVTQAGSQACSFNAIPASFSFAQAATGNEVAVGAPAGCFWTAASDTPWITVRRTSGVGNDFVGFDVAEFGPPAASLVKGEIRIGTIRIQGAGATLSVPISQTSDCRASLLAGPNVRSASFEADGGTGAVSVLFAPPSRCFWSAQSSATWLTITWPGPGQSPGVEGEVRYAVAANPTSSPRTATITAGGGVFTVMQLGRN